MQPTFSLSNRDHKLVSPLDIQSHLKMHQLKYKRCKPLTQFYIAFNRKTDLSLLFICSCKQRTCSVVYCPNIAFIFPGLLPQKRLMVASLLCLPIVYTTSVTSALNMTSENSNRRELNQHCPQTTIKLLKFGNYKLV